ncbi:alpha/beta family hydrolase [Thalassobius sp. Cn5-15]|uniref:alpha/beta family hydrolase n=1 Tax=Thalassobius sp. Cn5-15 TaxID=2917763 RepID=UPI001EF1CC1E|nr:alpha/beta family hydrolase [Thalassobius sp. Cn5-15]MCG7493605.1 alpha/beta hydrolase [Thalassobius sp. Cn5-15]
MTALSATFLFDGPKGADTTVLLAHGAGAAMDTAFMNQIAAGLSAKELSEKPLRVARFEFAYMAGRRSGGAKRPPPKMPVLVAEYRTAIAALREQEQVNRLIIGGKSMGGRVASLLLAAEAGAADALLCLGYPFHPKGKPDSLRTEHLMALRTPTLMIQGTRDPLGTADEVAGYALPGSICMHWINDGDHDLKPRKRVTGMDHAAALNDSCTAIASWVRTLR